MTFNEAWKLVKGIHDQNGDSSFDDFRYELQASIEKAGNYKDWRWNLQTRTDLSQDYKWDCECFDESFKVVFALMGKPLDGTA